MKLEGKVAYITGGTKGIGYGIAESLLEQGMKVAISGRSQESADAIKRKGQNRDVKYGTFTAGETIYR